VQAKADGLGTGTSIRRLRRIVLLGWAASMWAWLFAAISFYWAAGGTIGLVTLGTNLQTVALARDPLTILIGGWGAGAAKAIVE
jgi:hypothetical protein